METTTIVIIVILVVAAVVVAVALTNYFTEKNATPAPAPVPEDKDGYYLVQSGGVVTKRTFLRNYRPVQNLTDEAGGYNNMTILASGFVNIDSANELAYIKYDGVDYYLASDTSTPSRVLYTDPVPDPDPRFGKVYDMTSTGTGVPTSVLYTEDGPGLYMVSLYLKPSDGTYAIRTFKITSFDLDIAFGTTTVTLQQDSSNVYIFTSTSSVSLVYGNNIQSKPNGYFTDGQIFTNACASFGFPTPTMTNSLLYTSCIEANFFSEASGDYNITVDLTDNNAIKMTYTPVV